MERYMYHEDSFERMLKQKADEYRMYPSDQVWQRIQQQVHKSRNRKQRIIGAGLLVSFLSLSLYTSLHQHQPGITAYRAPVPSLAVPPTINNIQTAQTAPQIPTSVRRSTSIAVAIPQPTPALSAGDLMATTTQLDKEMPEATITAADAVTPAAEVIETVTITPNSSSTEAYSINIVAHNNRLAQPPAVIQTDIAAAPATSAAIAIPASKEEPANAAELQSDAALNYEVHVPVPAARRKPAQAIQVYMTPAASYRVLVANNRFTFGNFQRDPETAVAHRFSTGFEAGAAWLVPVSARLSFKVGLQYNYTRYMLTASKYMPELTTITLNTYQRIQRSTNLRNTNGFFPEELANETSQLSIPIGLEYTAASSPRLSFVISGTAQPTYLLNGSGYMATADYKNYIKAPDLLRTVNLNTAFETFVRWNAGAFQMQLGPQLRYQLFSNAEGRYPIREHLVDYGFKIGLIKTLR